jgi:hypothetical protein
VYTLDPARPWADAFAVRDGKVVLVGSEADVAAVTGSRTRVIHAEGAMVMPGLIDVHSHVGFGGQAAAWELGLSPTFGVEDILGAVRDRAGQLGRDESVVGGPVISPVFHLAGGATRRHGGRVPRRLTLPGRPRTGAPGQDHLAAGRGCPPGHR